MHARTFPTSVPSARLPGPALAVFLALGEVGIGGCRPCPDGFLRDNDGNCLQVDAGEADAADDDATGDGLDDDSDDDADDDDDDDAETASLFACNPLQYTDGSNLTVELSCGGAYWRMDSGECSDCEVFDAGTVGCEFDIDDGVVSGTFDLDLDEGLELAVLFLIDDGGSLQIATAEAECGSDLDDLL